MKKQTKTQPQQLQITVSGAALKRLKALQRLAGGQISLDALATGAVSYITAFSDTNESMLSAFVCGLGSSRGWMGEQ